MSSELGKSGSCEDRGYATEYIAVGDDVIVKGVIDDTEQTVYRKGVVTQIIDTEYVEVLYDGYNETRRAHGNDVDIFNPLGPWPSRSGAYCNDTQFWYPRGYMLNE
jgi:hypothetical protein